MFSLPSTARSCLTWKSLTVSLHFQLTKKQQKLVIARRQANSLTAEAEDFKQ